MMKRWICLLMSLMMLVSMLPVTAPAEGQEGAPAAVADQVEPAGGKAPAIDVKVTVPQDGGLRRMWESMPPQLLKALIARGRIPGEIKVMSGRVFRFLRPLCLELPFKLSLHDSLPELKTAGLPGKGPQ